MKTSEIKTLLKTVKVIGAEKHPDLDADFLEAVVNAEQQNPDDDLAAQRGIELALEKVLSKKRVR
jgi:hypothetical protein